MKKHTLIITAAITIALLSTNAVHAQKKSLKNIETEINMFPSPKEGYKQVFIKVPAKKNELDYKIEVFAGKTLMVDCNRHFMGGKIEALSLDGFKKPEPLALNQNIQDKK